MKRLYVEATNQPFFDWAFDRQRDCDETSVDTVMRYGRMDREAAVGLLQSLAEADVGVYTVGRRGAKTRIIWHYSLREIGGVARGSLKEFTRSDPDADEDESSDMVEHPFNLRPDRRISLFLPNDLTVREAERLAAFVKTLPLGE